MICCGSAVFYFRQKVGWSAWRTFYVSLSVFSLFYRQNDGILRSYVIIAVLLGMLAYDRMISRNMLKVLQKMLERIKINNQKRKKFRKKISEKRQIGDTDEE